jgi:hypothetical protein
MIDDPFLVLGVATGSSAAEVRAARRTLAKEHHPDTGGDPEVMRVINAAAAHALRLLAAAPERSASDAWAVSADEGVGSSTPDGWTVSSDIPSFTVEALPVETFEALLVVTTWIGEVVDDDPPYRLDTRLGEPFDCWCRLDLVPDAGASTVSITVSTDAGATRPNIVDVRDVWVSVLNQYDW